MLACITMFYIMYSEVSHGSAFSVRACMMSHVIEINLRFPLPVHA